MSALSGLHASAPHPLWQALRRPATLAALGMLLALTVVWITTFVIAAQPQTLDQRTHEVATQLRCPTCNGETVADASTPVANQMRQVIREKLAAGESEQQVIADFRASYGDTILASPPPSGFALFIWIGPWVMLLAGIAVVALAGREWRTSVRSAPRTIADETPKPRTVEPAEREHLRAALRRELAADEGLPLVAEEGL